MTKLFSIFILLLTLSASVFAQRIPASGFDKVRIVSGDRVIQADIKPTKDALEADPEKLYYWYSANVIHTTQGGFSGRLLNGDYREYYANKNLRELGEFNNGLKEDIWKSWTENGVLTQLYTWKRGIKSGAFSIYEETGKPSQMGTYRNNQLNGKLTKIYKAGGTTVTWYKNGVQQLPKPALWKRLNIFRKMKDTVHVRPTPTVNMPSAH